jgi:hypothetical protein
VTAAPGQLTLDVPDVELADLDLDPAGVEARLDAIDGVDFRRPLAPRCACSPHAVLVEDEFGELTCWLCGRPA